MRRNSPARWFLVALVVIVSVPLSAQPASAAPTRQQIRSWARLHRADGDLHDGCHRYRVRYRVTSPLQDWLLEIRLFDPDGRAMAQTAVVSGGDPRRGRVLLEMCGEATRPGRFTLRGRLSVTDHPDTYSAPIPAARFRLA